MAFEFAFLDWLQQFTHPVMDALAVFFNWAGMHGELWILFGVILLLLALLFYLLVGDMILKPLFARPRPCDLNTLIQILVERPNGHSFPSGHTSSAFAAAAALFCQNKRLGIPALVLAAFIGFTRLYLYVHFPTDVLAGILLGLMLGAAASALVNFAAKKRAEKKG